MNFMILWNEFKTSFNVNSQFWHKIICGTICYLVHGIVIYHFINKMPIELHWHWQSEYMKYVCL